MPKIVKTSIGFGLPLGIYGKVASKVDIII
jgi:hypothetical protein